MNTRWFKTRNKCPACTSNQFEIIYQNQYDKSPISDYLLDFYSPVGMVEFEYLEGANYILCKCNACSLIFQRDIPNDTLMERLYEHWIDPEKAYRMRQKKDGLERYSYYAQEIMQLIGYFKTNPSSLRFLDFGMGWGKWALMAKAFGCESFGTELSLVRIEHAKKDGIKIIEWDEIPQYSFDFINTEQIFEHIPEPLETLRHLKKGLKTDGVIKISVPSGNNIERRLKILDWKAPKGSRNSLNPVAPLEHINCFKRSSLAIMVNKANMEEVYMPLTIQYKYTTDWSSLERTAKNILLPVYRNLLKRQNYIFIRNRH